MSPPKNKTPSPTEAVLQYTGLVKKIVFDWLRRFPTMEPFREDLIQEGYVGLLRAIRSHKPEKGAFTTCAYPWITHFVRTAVLSQRGLTSRPVRPGQSKDRGLGAWAADFVAVDLEGEVITGEDLPGHELSPEEAVIRKDAVEKAAKALDKIADKLNTQRNRKGRVPVQGERDVAIFAERLTCDEPWKKGTVEEYRAKYGLTKERVRQIKVRVGERFDAWAARVQKEVA